MFVCRTLRLRHRTFSTLTHTVDRFNAVSVDLGRNHATESFGIQLHHSVQEWAAKGHKAVWIQYGFDLTSAHTCMICANHSSPMSVLHFSLADFRMYVCMYIHPNICGHVLYACGWVVCRQLSELTGTTYCRGGGGWISISPC